MKLPALNAVGVDIGGTKIAAGVVSFPEGIVLNRKIIPTFPERGGEQVLADVERLVRDVIRESNQTVSAVGLGVCEIVSTLGNLASECSLRWGSLNVGQRLSQIAPAIIDADVRAAATAEALFGAGREAESFLYVTIGTGISSCLVIGGKPYKGARGASGTMASGPIPRFRCEDKETFTLEQLAAGPALVERFRTAGGKANSGQEVLAAAGEGNGRAIEVVRSGAEMLGASIGWMVNILDPERVVLGGGLGLAEGLYRQALVAAVRRHVWWEGHRELPIISAFTGKDAGLIGAAAIACEIGSESKAM